MRREAWDVGQTILYGKDNPIDRPCECGLSDAGKWFVALHLVFSLFLLLKTPAQPELLPPARCLENELNRFEDHQRSGTKHG